MCGTPPWSDGSIGVSRARQPWSDGSIGMSRARQPWSDGSIGVSRARQPWSDGSIGVSRARQQSLRPGSKAGDDEKGGGGGEGLYEKQGRVWSTGVGVVSVSCGVSAGTGVEVLSGGVCWHYRWRGVPWYQCCWLCATGGEEFRGTSAVGCVSYGTA